MSGTELAMSGTEVAMSSTVVTGPAVATSGTEQLHAAGWLRACYAMSGTDLAYGATSGMSA
eukprot:3419954-Rhodomonas_salina.2